MKTKLLTLLLALGACAALSAKPVKNIDQAMSMVMKSVQKNKLLPMPIECVFFMEHKGEGDFPYYQISVFEKHNAACGGDPETTHRLMSYEVDKKTGQMRTDAIATTCYINKMGNQPHHCRGDVGEYMVPIDPISPVIIYDPPRPFKKVK